MIISFLVGILAGVFIGMIITSLCAVGSRMSRIEEQNDNKD